jgi:hypothetical protein
MPKAFTATSTAAECRAQAAAFTRMAQFLEERRYAVTNDPPRDWFVDLGDYMPTDENADNQIEWVMTPWAERHGLDHESLGFIPQFLHADDPRSAAEQIDASYQHGGGWKPKAGYSVASRRHARRDGLR